MKNLIIVESPTKARTLSRFLGKDFEVEATTGHLMDLPKSTLGVDVDNGFEPEYVLVEKRKATIKDLKTASKSAKNIFIATDPDREGEAIGAHVIEILKQNKTDTNTIKRISFHEITKSAVEEAINHPMKLNTSLVDAQVGRRVLDRLVGYKLSPVLWKKVRRGLSAGRVQSVAVKLIVEKEREINKFKPEEYWEIFVQVKQDSSTPKVKDSHTSGVFAIKLVKIDGKKADIKEGKTAKSIVSDLEKAGYVVLEVRSKEVKKHPYPPFTTSTMTQSAARLLGWSAKKTMSVAQKLYEEGLITYHRTDSLNIASSAITSARKYIENTFGNNYLPEKPKFYKTKSKSAQEAHEAIRPTDVKLNNIEGKLKKITGAEKLYNLIWKRFVACQMNPAIFDSTTIEVEASVPNTPEVIRDHISEVYLLRASGQVIKFDGWRKVIPLAINEEPELPKVDKNEQLALVKVDPQQKFTQPPARYNEASLIKTLEQLGIGRPSTYAPIISTIQLRQYVEKKEGKFFPTPVGVAVTDFLDKNFDNIMDYSFTAQMEDNLDNVAKGKVKWNKMIGDFYKPFEKMVVQVEKKAERVKIEAEKLGKKCPTCANEGRTAEKQGDLVIRVGRFGKFVSCSLFPECNHTEKYLDKIGMKCPECNKGEVIIKGTKRGRKFFGCSRYPDCKFASWQKPGVTGKDPNKQKKLKINETRKRFKRRNR